ncbi:aldehyde dehydrogenase family protein [Fodinicola feengrottensis]|uniref:aldehyde dehydrogenase family protein n=1 Tax=Fodinicola feengrottensis TaxID=435914 RepID=UPI002441F7A0|nr:aldehyde dehydrogenase family protein [Fodinicola feengrottensis]
MLAAAEAIVAAASELTPLLTAEQGKPLSQAATEVYGSAAWLKYFAGLELPREIIQDDKRGLAEVVRRPIGPVAAITPWNFPLLLAFWKIAPALRAGNTLVLKPSPFTPLVSLKIGEVLRDVLPPGVLNVVSGGNELGGLMTAHPVPRKVSFTGSIALPARRWPRRQLRT